MLNFICEALRTTGLLKGGFDTDEPICRNRDTDKENGLVDTEWRRRGWDEVKEQHRHICAAAAAAAASLQSCPTLCDPIDGSPPGSPVPGSLQARTLEWVAIAFSNAWTWKGKVKSLSRGRLLATPRTAAHQAPPSMGFSRQEYWSGCHCLLRIYALLCVKPTASGTLLHSTGSSAWCDDLEDWGGREVQEKGDMVYRELIHIVVRQQLTHHCKETMCACALSRFSCVQLFTILRTIAHQAPLSMRFSRREYWSGLPCPLPGALPNPGIQPMSLTSPGIGRPVLYHSRHLGSLMQLHSNYANDNKK